MATFIKTVLAPGVHRFATGPFIVTPRRLHHWEWAYRRLYMAGLAAPVYYGHDNSNEYPIAVEQYQRKVRAGVVLGRLVAFAASPESATAVLQIGSEEWARRMERNELALSFVFSDMLKESYRCHEDVIVSADLVPPDNIGDKTQGPFVRI